MDKFLSDISGRLSCASHHITAVKNPDGFFSRPDVQQAILKHCSLLLLPISNAIELRVRYELYDKHSHSKVCYIIADNTQIAPDIAMHIQDLGVINLKDLLFSYHATELSNHVISLSMASYLYSKSTQSFFNQNETKLLLHEAAIAYNFSSEGTNKKLSEIELDWTKVDTIKQISSLILDAIKHDAYSAIQDSIDAINTQFQTYLDSAYSSMPSSSHINQPKIVNKVLPHIAYKHNRTDKVALIVIDGMAYWQYLVLRNQLVSNSLAPQDHCLLSWIPSITSLARQSLFRGDHPQRSYIQNPASEQRLWADFWTSPSRQAKRCNSFEVSYQHGSLALDNNTALRAALVDVDLDEKMHASTSNKDLLSLTENWADATARDIAAIKQMGYTIYLTTDHGNILSQPWRSLTPQEKTFLYADGSRGTRHLTYNEAKYLMAFKDAYPGIADKWLTKDLSLVWRNNLCFKSSSCITHGGCHFLEMVIPFVKI